MAQIAAGFSRQDAATYATLCRAFLASGDVDKAQSAAQKALEEDPLSAEAHLAIARVRDAQGRPEEAREEAVRALDLRPYSIAAIEFSANLYHAAGEFAKCAELRQAALALNPWHAELHRQLADVLYEELGNPASAGEHYRRYVELDEMRKEAAR